MPSTGNEADDTNHEPTSYQPPPSLSSEGSDYAADDGESDSSSTSNDSGEVSEQLQPGQGTPSRKRKSSLNDAVRPRKRATGSIHRAYLDLLNEDILHAASQYVPLAAPDEGNERKGLPPSQLGMVIWSAMEKERFFEALGRVGRDNVPEIARRIRTKGEMEVRQYMKLLQDSIAQRQQFDDLAPLALAEFPAAVELSHECCEALEEAADNLAARQDHFETTVEQEKQGAGWLVSRDTWGEMTEEETGDNPWETSNLLNVPKWLMLSERFFMNAPSEDGNWQTVEGDTPSVRVSTLNDFRTLALTLTRRLVAASLYTANSRVRAERGYRSHIESLVRDKDVHAAAVSIGLSTRKPALITSIRKLGLQVYEGEPPEPSAEDPEGQPLSYEAVEDALADLGAQRRSVSASLLRRRGQIELSSHEGSSSSDSSAQSRADTDEAEQSNGSGSDEPQVDQDDEDVVAEANEAILYCAVDPPQTTRDRQALLRRIKAEREQEAQAEAVDAQASYQEEKRLWEMLGQQPPMALTDPGTPANAKRLSTKKSVDAGYVAGRDWRAKTRVLSEWERQVCQKRKEIVTGR